MIYLEVLKCSDPWAIGVYQFEFDQVHMGRSKRCDLIFADRELPLQFLDLKFIQGHLVVQSLCRSPFFFVNGKKVSGTLKIKEGDLIAFGENQIKLLSAKESCPRPDFTLAYEEFNKKGAELKVALEFIEQVLIDLEKETDV